MQNNSNTVEGGKPLPLDGEEIVTISRADFDAVVETAVSKAVAEFEAMFIRAMGKGTGKGERWLNTAAAAAVLGKRPDQLRRMVRDGRLRLNSEVRDDRPKNAINPVYIFDVEKCEKRLLTPPEKRGNK
jgi:hypothetical protein